MGHSFKWTVVAGIVSVLIAPSVGAEEIGSRLRHASQGGDGEVGSRKIRIRDLSRPATTVKDWMAQIEAATVQVTNVKLERTDTRWDITLETAEGKPLQVDATKFRTEGNSLIADIPNAVLALTNATEFSAGNLTSDIANVRVTQVDASNIRVIPN